MRQALRLRACDYITKPFDVSTMRAAVANAMQRRTLESEIHTNAEKLQQLLGELQNQKIEQQMAQTRGEIYGSIIHDINGPLTVISGFIQLMNQRIGNATRLEVEDLEFIKDRLKTITRQVTNCIEISRRYLSFLRRQSDDAPRVGVNQLLTDLGQLVRVHPSLQNNQFTVRPLAEDIAVRMNGTDVIQVLLNLTVNAFQCAPQRALGRNRRPRAAAAARPDRLQGRPAGPAAERGELRQHRAAADALRPRQRPGDSAARHCRRSSRPISPPKARGRAPAWA